MAAETYLVANRRPPEPCSSSACAQLREIAGHPLPAELTRLLQRLGTRFWINEFEVLYEPRYFQRDLQRNRDLSSECLPAIRPDRFLPLASVGNGDWYAIQLDEDRNFIEAVLFFDHEIHAPVDIFPGLAACLQQLLVR